MRLALALILAAAPAAARDPLLSLPLACTPGDDCYVQNYVDHDGGPGAADFACGPQSYDGHDGTDFALLSDAQMAAGVDVLAVAPGTVTAARDGMADVSQGAEDAPDVTGRECGNGVVIDHGGGWETQYCHMKRGTVAVERGRRVGAGTVLGQVGLSGQSEFPHVHLSVRRDGAEVDPFVPDGIVRCGEAPGSSLWRQELGYVAGGILAVGVTDGVPEYAEVTGGTAALEQLSATQDALVIWGAAHGVRAGDLMELRLTGPGGVVLSQVIPLERTQARLFRAIGKRTRLPWPAGDYRALAILLRGRAEVDRAEITVPLR
jgi:murein DD-endopeptidase MepM/ murein hydrolase activator NlpD